MESLATAELGAFLAASPLLRAVGRGDRHPVLVIPGFTQGDQSTQALRWVLRGQGYWVHGWGLGTNWGPGEGRMDAIGERLLALHERHETTISVIGWSLGGIYARQIAREHPEAVRQVITLGSPFRLRPGDKSRASALYEQINGKEELPPGMDVPEEERPPLTVPATAIYSRTDGVVRWHRCIEAEGPLRESIEVRGSHSGLGHNPAVIIAVADRLARRGREWRPFRPPLGTASLFPKPATWHPREPLQV
jgi:hypothetical protein